MPGILLIAHAPLASALRECAAHVHGQTPARLEVVDVPADAAPGEPLPAVDQALQRLADEAEVLVLVDAFGATPCNLARALVRQHRDTPRLHLVSGVNLPMLLRAICYRSEPLEALAARAVEGGRRGIEDFSDASETPTC